MGCNPRTGEELMLAAAKKELERLTRKASAAKKKADECLNVGSELVSIHEDFARLIDSKASPEAKLEGIRALDLRQNKVNKLLGTDTLSLLDKENEAAIERDNLKREIANMEFSINVRKGRV